MGTAY